MNNIAIKKSIPNFITLTNLFLGFTSIILLSLSIESTIDYIKTACYLILLSAILDSVDGKIARKLNISSNFGKEIDSLADLVSFCIVPSFLIFVYYTVVLPDYIHLVLLIILSSFPLILGAIRLAQYNALDVMRESDKYLGLPTPSNAILICSLILFTMNLPARGLFGMNEFEVISYKLLGWIIQIEYMILLISILSSMLLISKVNYEKFPLISFKISKKNNKNLIKVILFLIILIVSIYYSYYDIILLIFISIYIFGNTLKFLVNFNKTKESSL